MTLPNLCLVVIHYGDPGLTRHLLHSLSGHPDREMIRQVVIVDNGASLSEREAAQLLEVELPVQLVVNRDRSYASGVNRGVAATRENLVAIVNNDVWWHSGSSIRTLVSHMEDRNVGIGGPQLLYPDGSWQRSGGDVPSVFSALKSALFIDSLAHVLEARRMRTGSMSPGPQDVQYVDGAFMVVRREVFETLQGFDERYFFYGEDADFCLRARRRGWRVILDKQAKVVHERGASSSKADLLRYAKRLALAQRQFVRAHYGAVAASLFTGLCAWAHLERALLYESLAWILSNGRWHGRAHSAWASFVADLQWLPGHD